MLFTKLTDFSSGGIRKKAGSIGQLLKYYCIQKTIAEPTGNYFMRWLTTVNDNAVGAVRQHSRLCADGRSLNRTSPTWHDEHFGRCSVFVFCVMNSVETEHQSTTPSFGQLLLLLLRTMTYWWLSYSRPVMLMERTYHSSHLIWLYLSWPHFIQTAR